MALEQKYFTIADEYGVWIDVDGKPEGFTVRTTEPKYNNNNNSKGWISPFTHTPTLSTPVSLLNLTRPSHLKSHLVLSSLGRVLIFGLRDSTIEFARPPLNPAPATDLFKVFYDTLVAELWVTEG